MSGVSAKVQQGGLGRAFAVYTGLRSVLFAVFYGVLLLVGARGPLVLVAALLLSSLASLFGLRSQRARFAAALADRRDSRDEEKARLRGLLEE